MSEVKLISECYIRPQHEVDDSKKHYHLNSSDLSMLLLGYANCGHLFTKPQNFSLASFLEKLKLSLSISLIHFYPLAGQLATLRYEDEHSCCIYIDCHKGLGAKLIGAAAIDVSVEDITSSNADIPKVVRSFFDVSEKDELVNYDGHTKPLFSAQVTELADGLFLGTSINHCVADGNSSIHFLNTWSEIFMSTSPSFNISHVPVYQYGASIRLPYLHPDEFLIRSHDGGFRERMFHFSATSIAMLKAKANAEASDIKVELSSSLVAGNISSFQALSAFIWRSITRARNSCFSDTSTSTTTSTCSLVANLRSRFEPPLSQDYFGNFLMPAKGTAQVGELLANSLGWTALMLHRAVVNLYDEVARGVFSQALVDESPQLLLPGLRSQGANPVLMVGSPRIDFYGPQFGLGRAVSVLMGYENKDGLVTVYPGAKAHGSVDIQVCLAPQTMTLLLSDTDFMSFLSHANSD